MDLMTTGTTPDDDMRRREQREALRASLEALAPDRARAVKAHLAGFSVEEIMALCGWPYQRARNLIARGMADLRGALRERGMS
jgi:DNA-directed RNA polymerase specialized sigma24 family protein